MRECAHGVSAGRFCARCARRPRPPVPAYCYSRELVIALNPIRKAQGLPPLREGDPYR